MKSSLSITLVQTDLYWQDKTANLAMLEEKIWDVDPEMDIIVLPEMFNTGFSMKVAQIAEPENFNTFKWMQQIAANTQAAVVGSYTIKAGTQYYNRLLWVFPDGSFKQYDKRHLFRMMDEHEHYQAGTEQLIVEWQGWKFCPLICYDLRFPVWSRNVALNYDCLLYVANWPQARINAWNTLLQARAIENSCYVVGVNRIGIDGNGIDFGGDSQAIDFKGNIIEKLNHHNNIQTISIEKHPLLSFREKFPVHQDADHFELIQ